VQFSPTSASQPWSQTSNGLIGQTLSTATKTVDLALFVFSEQSLANLLETNHQQGVQVRGLIDPVLPIAITVKRWICWESL
jgi:phosphatidylserine/phosphatidylglycerophosphate/cardiolipin synthase-like enzyme